MDVTSVPSPGRRRPATVLRTRRGRHALAGAAAFWLANLALSATPVAAGYRSAMEIAYVPMLLEAAAGGLALAVTVGVATGEPGPGRSRAPGRTRRESTT